MSQICGIVDERYVELGNFQIQLEKRSRLFSRWGAGLKVALILLGAASATKASADEFFGSSTSQSIAFYGIVGLLTTIVAGLSTGFKPEDKGGKLAGLAAECASTRALIEFGWDKVRIHNAGSLAPLSPADDLKLTEDLLQRLTVKLNDIYARAAPLGVEPEMTEEKKHLPGVKQVRAAELTRSNGSNRPKSEEEATGTA
jgi:hypothetical protein